MGFFDHPVRGKDLSQDLLTLLDRVGQDIPQVHRDIQRLIDLLREW